MFTRVEASSTSSPCVLRSTCSCVWLCARRVGTSVGVYAARRCAMSAPAGTGSTGALEKHMSQPPDLSHFAHDHIRR